MLVLGFCSASAFAQGTGTAVGVDPDAIARIRAQERILQVGTDVSVGETIVTGPSGQVQLVFDDATRLVVGPGSSLLVETYLLASNNSAQNLTINALGGSFRFLSGNSPKAAYSINTPTATIAVRGTEFDLIVDRSSTRVLLYEGAVQLCGVDGTCQELTRRCEIGIASRGQTALLTSADPQRAPFGLEFRYARFQSPLLRDFRVDGASNCVGQPSTGGSLESLSTFNSDSDRPDERDPQSPTSP